MTHNVITLTTNVPKANRSAYVTIASPPFGDDRPPEAAILYHCIKVLKKMNNLKTAQKNTADTAERFDCVYIGRGHGTRTRGA